MRPYFEKMTPFGKPLSDSQRESGKENVAQIKEVEKQVAEAVEAVKNAGIPAEKIKQRGQTTVWERIEYLVDPGTWCPLHTLYNPLFNEEGTTGVIDGLATINGKWAVVIGFDNKVMAGAWIAGQADNQLRVTDIAKRLHVPLVWLVNCSGVKLTEQEEVYANRRGNGTTFFRHAELEKMGIPILAGIYGTNPAGGGYQGISPTILLAHKDANIAVGGGGIVSGMSKNVLLLGDRGKMGLALRRAFEDAYTVTGKNTSHFDAARPTSLEGALSEQPWDIVINTVAFMGIDACEDQPDKALRVNALFPRWLAEQSVAQGFLLVHFSTDAVFDGTARKRSSKSAKG